MCGIAGIVDLRGEAVTPSAIEKITGLIAHRGPDGAGFWFSDDKRIALGHRRLAIIDPGARGDQPMHSGDGRFVIVYNGEVYNFLELRAELQAAGVPFRTESDTEVILAAWQAWGPDMLLRFNGMWALAIADKVSGDVFLARDRFGIKPLLYSISDGRLVFASEMRAIVRSGLVPTDIDADAARRIMVDAFGIEGSERTLHREIKRLQGGHHLWIRGGRTSVTRWWRTLDHLPQLPSTEAERVERFGQIFRDAVALRMRSDVPIGTCLSGGFDSSAIICTMSEAEKKGMGPRGNHAWRHAFVASFPGSPNDERPQAEEAAAWAGVEPTILQIGDDDALRDFDRVLEDMDEVYIGLPTAVWLIYRELRRQKVLVSLDGHGADELMGGYLQAGGTGAFWMRNVVSGIMERWRFLSNAVDFARAALLKRRGHFFLRGGLSSLPRGFAVVGDEDHLPTEWGSFNRRLYRMLHGTVLPTILRNFDRLSMAHGIEVRMPFLDWRLVTYAVALPEEAKYADGYSKLIARRAMAGCMPESIRTAKRKIGFNSPMPEWLNGPLSSWTASLLAKKVEAFTELVDEPAFEKAVLKLNRDRSWDWESAGRIWPYLHMKWVLARLPG
ncbi:asparagine synthase (glutamine-hydrolyzing) [Bradyrhizobium sp. AUGA SZCCT0158]|uniref:asparagine synthase (glutamine-hydrolyzing) n=1 Tax=Bradyrhizobium sp. AUGA SZCCT0158 TaxID=2807661 RepID=UPI001BA80E07|nr:asparagine synthase (glutamine-hydrolyzing) [Bradyrhizobium sp. AUGA SZCCT0158]MBR1194852.1 asparagine synthase (glutamine-hydrolyzing) [Bradyrhizobium sp. AUGA SZCCT0158]